jgi:hypothetical protein
MFFLLTITALAACAMASSVAAQTNAAAVSSSLKGPSSRKFHAVDADNHNILINRPGMITLVLGTSEDSQDAARAAGVAVYPFQGRPDFQLIVVVDLRDSIATWAPSIVLSQMRSNLDQEAIALKPFFLKNGNKNNPRASSYVIPDFSGTICPQLGWTESSDSLRGILFGTDGREIERWDKIEDMDKLQADIRARIQVLIDAEQARESATVKTQGSKLVQPVTAHPPLLPPNPPGKTD